MSGAASGLRKCGSENLADLRKAGRGKRRSQHGGVAEVGGLGAAHALQQGLRVFVEAFSVARWIEKDLLKGDDRIQRKFFAMRLQIGVEFGVTGEGRIRPGVDQKFEFLRTRRRITMSFLSRPSATPSR